MVTSSETQEKSIPDQPAARINLAGTFTIEGLAPALNYLADRLQLNLDVEFAPYHQVFQELLSADSLLSSNNKGVNVVLIRVEDFIRDDPDGSTAQQTIVSVVDDLTNAARAFSARSKVPAVYIVFDPTVSNEAANGRSLAEQSSRLAHELQALPATKVLRSIDVDKLCLGDRLDPVGDELGHVPYTDEYMGAIALAIARAVRAHLVPPHKVLVLDCDNTIWHGVVGEDSVTGISIPPELAAVQRFAIDVQANGGLVCLASKNVEEDVLEVFQERADMLLKMEHIVDHRVNWDAKYVNISSMASALNLGLDSFVFLDDNPVECGHMRAQLPEVVTLLLPERSQIPGFLDNLWLFDRVSLTEEDARRTQMYRENAAREVLESSTKDISQFIESLQMVIDIAEPTEAEWARVAQLTQKTNQFNFTTRRRSEAEMRALAKGGARVLAIHVRDRFGDYGLVGLVVASSSAAELLVDTFVLSCRVLGRGVEHAVMRRLAEEAGRAGLDTVAIPFIATAKNKPAQAFIDDVAADFRETTTDGASYRIPAPRAATIEHRPGHDPEAVIAASRSEGKKPSARPASPAISLSERYESFALELNSGSALLRAVKSQALKSRPLIQTATAATNETECRLIAIWEDVMAIDGIGIDDDYSELGGTSLMAVGLFGRISAEFNQTLPLTTILTAPTVRTLAVILNGQPSGVSKSIVKLAGHSAPSLYLVHEGNGEILLYRNIAQKLASHFSVFGVRPAVLPDVPIAHDSVESMAGHYVQELLAQKPSGPIYLGGLCAGGVIAFEMARQLQSMGHAVDRIFLLDAASPQAPRRAGTKTEQSMNRLRQRWTEQLKGRGLVVGTVGASLDTMQKAIGLLRRKWQSRAERKLEERRLASLQRALHAGAPWPRDLRPMTAMEIYGLSERKHKPRPLPGIPVSLIRATAGEGNDRPLSVVYSEPTLGWDAVAHQLEVLQVEGGHASMFQQENAAGLADVLRARMQPEPAPTLQPVSASKVFAS